MGSGPVAVQTNRNWTSRLLQFDGKMMIDGQAMDMHAHARAEKNTIVIHL